MSRMFTGKITRAELAGAIAYAYAQIKGVANLKDNGKVPDMIDAENYLEQVRFYDGKYLSPTIEKDLAKVEFDAENSDWDNSWKITGFKTLASGLTCLCFRAGGDWEYPIAYVVYYDGTKLRAYIPSGGNHYNRKTKKAYGNDDSYDGTEDEFEKCEGIKEDDVDEDKDVKDFWADVEGHIVFVNGKFVKPKGMSDIDFSCFSPVGLIQAKKDKHLKYLSDLEKGYQSMPPASKRQYDSLRQRFDLMKSALLSQGLTEQGIEDIRVELESFQRFAQQDQMEARTIRIDMTPRTVTPSNLYGTNAANLPQKVAAELKYLDDLNRACVYLDQDSRQKYESVKWKFEAARKVLQSCNSTDDQLRSACAELEHVRENARKGIV
jgi:hypothetical protein